MHKNFSSRSIDINVKGEQNDFPAYELVIGHKAVYRYDPSYYGYKGPGFRNLWKSRQFSETEWIRLSD
ncbi:MAG: hypothetical protein AAF620_11000 [Bacteroidota bacterium]